MSLFLLPDVFRVIKTRSEIRRVSYMHEEIQKRIQHFGKKILKERDSSRDLDVDRRIAQSILVK
jgi:hypothetical protein